MNRFRDARRPQGPPNRNILPQSCPGLRLERAFTYNTTIDQLWARPKSSTCCRTSAACRSAARDAGWAGLVPVEYVKDDKAD